MSYCDWLHGGTQTRECEICIDPDPNTFWVSVENFMNLYLVDNITNRLDRTNVSIQRETAHIQIITRTDNTCGYWVVILLLFVAIMVVSIL